jgi:hypothetical protein
MQQSYQSLEVNKIHMNNPDEVGQQSRQQAHLMTKRVPKDSCRRDNILVR